MNNNIAKIFKIIATITFICGFIAGIYYGIALKSFVAFLLICFASFLEGILFYGVSEIIDNLDQANIQNRAIYNVLVKIEKNTSKHSTEFTEKPIENFAEAIRPVAATIEPNPFTWNCPHCGNLNLSANKKCKKCDYIK